MKKIILPLLALSLCIPLASCTDTTPTSTIKYIVTFNSNCSDDVDAHIVSSGSKINIPIVVNAGYTLTGWYRDSDLNEDSKWNFDTDRVTSDITLYAGWEEINNTEEITNMFVTINNNKLEITLVDNSSSRALVELLKQGDIIFTANDYGNFEKYGPIGHSLPRNDTSITTSPGDVILYQGNQIALYYGINTWTFTRLGRIEGYEPEEYRTLLSAGSGAIQVKLSLN